MIINDFRNTISVAQKEALNNKRQIEITQSANPLLDMLNQKQNI